MRWGRLIKLREKTNGKKTRPSTLTTGKLSGSKKCCLLFVNIPGTPATVTQLAKDVCTFLKWAAGKRFFLFSHFREVKGVCHLPKNFGNFDGKCHRVKNVCNFTFVSLSLFSKFKMAGQILPWIAWIWRILLKNWKWNSYYHLKNFQPEN